jgi:hypothetical protein
VIIIDSGEFTMSGENAAITNNKADYCGGGVCILGKAGQVALFTLSGKNATISGNYAGVQGGGGVYVEVGTFTMKNGIIYGNDAGATLKNTTAAALGAAVRLFGSGVTEWPAGTTGYEGIDSTTPLAGNIGVRDLTVKATTP